MGVGYSASLEARRGDLLMGQIPVSKKKKMNMGIFSQQQWQTGNFKKKDEDEADDEEIGKTVL